MILMVKQRQLPLLIGIHSFAVQIFIQNISMRYFMHIYTCIFTKNYDIRILNQKLSSDCKMLCR